jgi:hypothetical protein
LLDTFLQQCSAFGIPNARFRVDLETAGRMECLKPSCEGSEARSLDRRLTRFSAYEIGPKVAFSGRFEGLS